MPVELFHHAFPKPGATAALACQLEAAGWDGLVLADSQNLVADPFMELVLAATGTRALQLGTATTNPVTRDPAVIATSMLTLQAESKGRAVLGISRGDSALSLLGLPPAPMVEFERRVRWARSYLRGEPVQRGNMAARISWATDLSLPPVPVDVHATGPRMLALGAVLADRLTVAVGADREWVGWAIDTARRAREAAGLDPYALQIGGFFMAATGQSPGEAVELVRGNVAIFAHIAGRDGTVPAAVPQDRQDLISRAVRAYEEAEHGTSVSRAAQLLPEDFVRWFAVAGPPSEVVDRLSELCSLGLRHLVLVGPARDIASPRAADAIARFDEAVVPALHAAT